MPTSRSSSCKPNATAECQLLGRAHLRPFAGHAALVGKSNTIPTTLPTSHTALVACAASSCAGPTTRCGTLRRCVSLVRHRLHRCRAGRRRRSDHSAPHCRHALQASPQPLRARAPHGCRRGGGAARVTIMSGTLRRRGRRARAALSEVSEPEDAHVSQRVTWANIILALDICACLARVLRDAEGHLEHSVNVTEGGKIAEVRRSMRARQSSPRGAPHPLDRLPGQTEEAHVSVEMSRQRQSDAYCSVARGSGVPEPVEEALKALTRHQEGCRSGRRRADTNERYRKFPRDT